GEGVVNTAWHSYAIIDKFTPRAAPAMHAARQQHGELAFTAINDLQRPLALATMLLLVPLMLWGGRRQAMADLGWLGTTTAFAPTEGAGIRIDWEVKRRFRLFRRETDFQRHVRAARAGSVLAAERQLETATGGRG